MSSLWRREKVGNMAEFSTMEIAALVNKSERQVQRWIKSGKLKAQHIGGNRYEVDESDIERFVPHTIAEGYLERIEVLEHKVEALERKLEALASDAQPPVRTVRPPRTTYEPGPVQPQHVPSERPDGTITLQELANELGISRSTLFGHVSNPEKHLEHIALPIKSRPGHFDRYFTEEQADAVRVWHAAHTKK